MLMSAPAELVKGGCHNAEIKVYVNKRRLSLLMAIFFFFSFQPSILFLNLDDFTITPFFVLYVLPFHLPALSFLSLQLSVYVVLLFSVREVTEDLRVTSSNPTFSLGFKCFLAADDGDDETDFHCLKFTWVEDQMELTYKLHHMSFI